MKMRHKGKTLFVSAIGAILALASGTSAVDFERIVIDRGNSEGCSVADVNNDGMLDIVCLPDWYRAPHWDKRPVHELERSNEFIMNYGQIPMDVNGDGFVDIVSAGWYDKDIFWYENPTFPKEDPPKFKNWGKEYKTWKRHLLPRPPALGGGCETVMGFDVDNDGRLDVVPNRRPLGWYRVEKNAAGAPAFKRYPVDLSGRRHEDWLHGLGFGDINGDGRKDLITGEGWWEAPKNPRTDKWTEHRDFKLHDAGIPILIVDIDEDGDSDFFYGHGHNYGLFWMEQTGKSGKEKWVQHTIDKSISQAHALAWVDIDADGRNELVTGKRWRGHSGDDPGAADPMGIYYYKFNPATLNAAKTRITEGERIGVGMQLNVVDIDRDGDLDIVAPGKSGLYLLKNRTKR